MACLDGDEESSISLRSNHGHDSLSSDVAYEAETNRACFTLAQLKAYLLLGFYSIPLCWFMMSPVFIAYEPNHNCDTGYNDSDVRSFYAGKCSLNETRYIVENGSLEMNSSLYFPDSCPYGVDFADNETATISHQSIVTEWLLVCNDSYYSEISTMIFICGQPLGNIIFTPIADRFGRKWVVLVTGWIAALIGLVISAVGDYHLFCVLRFLQSAFAQGAALIAFTLMIEKLEPRQRNLGGVGYNFFWALGVLLLSLMAYFLRNWRTLYLAMSLPAVVTISYVWFISESIPWLYAKQVRDIQNNIEKTRPTRKKKKRADSSPVIRNEREKETSISSDSPRLSFDKTTTTHLAHLCNAKVLKRLAIVGYLWFVNNLAYYGLSLSTPILNGNLYLNFFLSGLVEIPATVLVLLAISFVGRRVLMALFFIVGGIALGVLAFLPEDVPSEGRVALFMAGKFAISGSYTITFLYSQEVFPTIVRSSAVGIVSSIGVAASILAPNAFTLSKIGGAVVTNSVFCGTMLLAGFLVLLLPETLNKPLPTSINDL